MQQFSEEFVEEVLARTDMLEVVGRAVTLRKAGANWQGLCPFHNEKTPSFSVRPDKGLFKCFGCGEGGDIIDFLKKLRGVSFPEAVEELAHQAGIPLPVDGTENPEEKRRRQRREELLAVVDKAQRWYSQCLRLPVASPAQRYLEGRGLDKAAWERYGLGFAPPGWSGLLDHFGGGHAAGMTLDGVGLVIRREGKNEWYDRFRDRIIFPIRDGKGRCVGFGGRLMQGDGPKYINSPESLVYHKGKLLYGMDQALEPIRRAEQALVVEGYMDRLSLAQHGVENVVATLGTALTAEHLKLLWQRARRVIFCFDGDNAGRKAAWRALEMALEGLEPDRHIRFLFLPNGEDPDDTVRREGGEAFRQRLTTATTLMEFLVSHLEEGLNMESAEGRAALIHRARPLLQRVGDPLLRDLYQRELGERFQLGVDQIVGDPAPTSYWGTHHHEGEPPSVRVEPRWQKPESRSLPPPVVGTKGRDNEQLLLAILLRHPDLVLLHEEELGCVELKNPHFGQLLSELIAIAHRHNGPPRRRKVEDFSTPSLAKLAMDIWNAEPLNLASPEAEQELRGCMTTLEGCALEQERHALNQNRGGDRNNEDDFLAKTVALKKEQMNRQALKKRRV